MKVLLTGALGQVGQVVQMTAPRDCHVYAFSRSQLDITERQTVIDVVQQIRPHTIINAAAYTRVDGAEAENTVAYAVNAQGAQHLAHAADAVGARFIHLSSDFVFDGKKSTPYVTTDPARPLNVYGASKLAGETVVKDVVPEAVLFGSGLTY